MKMRLLVISLQAVLFFVPTYGPASMAVDDQPSGISCVEEIMIPEYSYVARRVALGGDVEALVSLGPEGKVASISFVATKPDLAEEVRGYLVKESRFRKECAGKKVRLFFTFRLEGEPEVSPSVNVRFRPPDHFILVSQPRKPIIN